MVPTVPDMQLGVFMCFTAFNNSRVVLAVLLMLAVASSAQMKPGDRRKAYGDDRASVAESVLTTLYPGAEVQWDPALTVLIPGQKPHTAHVPVVVRGNEKGEMEGVASVEFDGEKEKFIFEAKHFQRRDNPAFSTVLVVFRADAAGRLKKYKKIILDPSQPVTELKTMSIQEWPAGKEWPTLIIQYDTHVASEDSFATIEWHSVIDANTGKVVTRLPYGITRKLKSGAKQVSGFSITRDSPTTIQIADHINATTRQYHCSEPCVVDPQLLLSQWVH
jgi:hypothetical protein